MIIYQYREKYFTLKMIISIKDYKFLIEIFIKYFEKNKNEDTFHNNFKED